jgi:hypothetical protein
MNRLHVNLSVDLSVMVNWGCPKSNSGIALNNASATIIVIKLERDFKR